MDLEAAVASFLLDVTARALSPKTYRRYESDLADLIRFLHERSVSAIEQVTADSLRTYFTNLHTRPNQSRPTETLSPYSIEGMYRTILTFFRFCEMEEYVMGNPMKRVRRPKLPKRIVPRLTEDQITALLHATQEGQMPERDMALIMLLVDSGLRRGEVVGLVTDHVVLSERIVRVLGKGQKWREVPIGDASLEAMKNWLAVRPTTSYPNVFLTDDGTPFKAEGVRALLTRLQVRTGIRRLYPHLLRHTFAKHYLKRVKDVKSLQQILGHAKSSTTLDMYVQFDIDELREMHRLGSPVDAIKKAQLTSVAH